MCFLILADLFVRSGTAGIVAQEVVLLWHLCTSIIVAFLEGNSEQMIEEKYSNTANLS